MKTTPSSPRPSIARRLAEIWPQGPLSACLVAVGLLNIINEAGWKSAWLPLTGSLDAVGSSFSAVGSTAQLSLGLLLVGSGIGLWWRLVSAWTLSVLLLAIMLGIDLARQKWGAGMGLELALLVILFLSKSRFSHRTILAQILYSASGIIAVLAYSIFGSYLMGSGFSPPIRDLDTAAYFSVTTLSTVGFGDIVPVTTETRWFVVSLLVIGLGVFATAIASTLGPKISQQLNRFLNPKEKKMEATNHVILVGDGAIARNTSHELSRRGDTVVRIVSAANLPADPSAHVIVGDATDQNLLRQAGIQHARLLIAAREDDSENAFITLGAKELNPGLKVLAVATSAQSIRRLQLARADEVFSPAAAGSRLLANLAGGAHPDPVFGDLYADSPAGKPPAPGA